MFFQNEDPVLEYINAETTNNAALARWLHLCLSPQKPGQKHQQLEERVVNFKDIDMCRQIPGVNPTMGWKIDTINEVEPKKTSRRQLQAFYENFRQHHVEKKKKRSTFRTAQHTDNQFAVVTTRMFNLSKSLRQGVKLLRLS